MYDRLYPTRMLRGEVRAGLVIPSQHVTWLHDLYGKVPLQGIWVPWGRPEPNATLFGWATIVGQLLRGSPDGKDWRISTMYFEFENNGGAAVSPPAFSRSGGKTYYDGLSSDVNRDYLRVPIGASTLDSTDEADFPQGNLVTFIAQTSGVAGVHGKPFSSAVSSRVFGAALVATPDFDDPSQDVVHSRFYFSDADNQIIKPAGPQISLSWALTLQ